MIQLYIIKQIKLPGPLGLLVTSNLNYKISKQKHNNYSLDRYNITESFIRRYAFVTTSFNINW